MKLQRLVNRVQDSQFFVPTLFIAASLVLVLITNRLDNTGTSVPLLITTGADTARSVLGTVAASIITVAALVFSFSAVTVQLAANQYSPRVVHGFLRNRFQQSVVGLVMGTFTYALTALALVDSAFDDDGRVRWTVTLAVLLGLASALAIVAFIDHITRRVRIDDTIRRITKETTRSLQRGQQARHLSDEPWKIPASTDSVVFRTDRAGYVQGLNIAQALAALPAGAVARFDTRIGEFVSEGHRLFTVWLESSSDSEVSGNALINTVLITDFRSVGDDPGFGLRQLVDIALRALSPGINDPATAAEVVSQLGTCFRTAFATGPANRFHAAENGARLSTPRAFSPSERTDRAYTPIRRAASDSPLVLEALIASVSSLDDELSEQGRDVPILHQLVEDTQSDLDRILRHDPQAH